MAFQIPGIAHKIGNHIGPNKNPNILKVDEYIHPAVTKKAQKTNGK
jgi:hypothetical protein